MAFVIAIFLACGLGYSGFRIVRIMSTTLVERGV